MTPIVPVSDVLHALALLVVCGSLSCLAYLAKTVWSDVRIGLSDEQPRDPSIYRDWHHTERTASLHRAQAETYLRAVARRER